MILYSTFFSVFKDDLELLKISTYFALRGRVHSKHVVIDMAYYPLLSEMKVPVPVTLACFLYGSVPILPPPPRARSNRDGRYILNMDIEQRLVYFRWHVHMHADVRAHSTLSLPTWVGLP